MSGGEEPAPEGERMAKATVTKVETTLATRRGPKAGVEYRYATGCCGAEVVDRTRACHAPRGKVRCPSCKAWNEVGA